MIAKFLHQVRSLRSYLTNLPTGILVPLAIGTTGLVVAGGLLTIRHIGGLQSLELATYDQMVRLRPELEPDPRLLIVGITEADIKAQKRWPLTDQTIATLLQKLQQHQPEAIGLDLYRDLPQAPGTQQLAQQLQHPNVMVITKIGDDTEELGIAPPSNVPDNQIGFNDLAIDVDGVVRRNLMFADNGTTTLYSLSLRLALPYLHNRGIIPKRGLLNPENLRLGNAEFIPLESDSGPYQKLDARGSQTMLTYRRRNPARRVTLMQVLDGAIDPSWVKGKIVLIGTTARSAKDLFPIPYSAAEWASPSTPGVMIHAQMVSQILGVALGQDKLVWFWPEWLEILWITAWIGVGGYLAWVLRHPLAFGSGMAASMAVLLAIGYGLFLQQGWVPIATPAIGLGLMAISIVTYRAQQSQRQQQMMMKLLGQNTSPEIANTLWKSRDRLLKSGKLPGQKFVATMLFTDIKNFSTISEQLSPEALLEWLNEYLSAITQEVRSRQGIINKFTGDGLLAVFGVPVNRTTPIEVSTDAQQAVECGLAMGRCLENLNQDWAKRGLPTVQMRVGIFTGPIVAGSLGGKDRLEYGVIGDSVNIASRLESYEKERQSELCRVLIAKDTLEHLQDKFEVENWGLLPLKGKQQKVNVYRVISPMPAGTGSPTDSTPVIPKTPANGNIQAKEII